MTFRGEAEKVRDRGRNVWLRLSSLRACVRRVCQATGQSYEAAVRGYGIDAPPPWSAPPGDGQLLGVLADVEARRAAYLEQRREFDAARHQAKRTGNRQLSNLERARLSRIRDPAAVEFVAPKEDS